MDEGVRNPSSTVLMVSLDQLVRRPGTMLETFWAAASASWLDAMGSFPSLLKGGEALQARLEAAAYKAPARLNYIDETVEAVRAWRGGGGRVELVSAGDAAGAVRVSDHLGLFDDVHGGIALKGGEAEPLDRLHGSGGYSVIAPDGLAEQGWIRPSVAGPGDPSATSAGAIGPIVRLLRPHQWLKNALIFVPMLAAHELTPAAVWNSALAFVAFCLIASATYILNDLLDLNVDRAHPRKRNRPLASGAVSLARGTLLMPALALTGVGAALWCGPELLGVLLLYFAVTTAYSFKLKRLVVIDVCTLAVLYTLRILAGSAATGIPSSTWLLAFSTFFFFSLAAVKRQAELVDGVAAGRKEAHGRGYRTDDLFVVSNMAISAGMVSVLVLALYANSEPVQLLYRTPEMLWGVCLVLLFWNSRMAILTQRGQMHDDPLVFAAKDRVSLACGAAVAALAGAGIIL